MSITPSTAPTHPTWCDVADFCTGTDAVAARGGSPGDIHPYDAHCHRSTVLRIPAGIHEDVEIDLSLWSEANEPTVETPSGVEMVINHVHLRLTVSVPISPAQVAYLREAFEQYGIVINTASAS